MNPRTSGALGKTEYSPRGCTGRVLHGCGGDFDPATDILGITVNRWSHGYAYEQHFHQLFDDDYDDPDDPRYTHVQARKRMGRIAIANSDSGALAMVEGAVEQAHRAGTELLNI